MADDRFKRSIPSFTTHAAVLAAVLLAWGCGGKDEPAEETTPPPATKSADASQPARPADDWSWADSNKAPATAPAAVPEPEPQPEKPIAKPSPRKAEPKPVNKLSPPPSDESVNLLSGGAPAPAPAPAPKVTTLTAPSGTAVTMRLDTGLSSETAEVGQAVAATISHDVTDAAGAVVLPAGTRLTGTVTQVEAARRVHKKSSLAFRFDSAQLPDGTTTPLIAGTRLEGKGYTKKDGAIIGGSAAGGALLGQLLGKDTKSTAEGAVIGGAIASGVVMSKKGEDVEVPAGTELQLSLEAAVTVHRKG